MTYLDRCNDRQIGGLMRCYADNYTDIKIDRQNDVINVELTVNGIPENYSLTDYDVTSYDWDDSRENCLHNYRLKMLGYFGKKYAIDYLLNC